VSALVGIIANPASGKDIRRLVAQATTVADHTKVSIISQALVGLGAVGVEKALIMPDRQGLGLKASQRLAREGATMLLPEVEMLELTVRGDALDTTAAAQAMRERGAGSIIVLGGDGTARAAAKGAGQVPLLCVSTGTNNVLPVFVDGTIAGMAAGVVACGVVPREQAAYRAKRLAVSVDEIALDSALVDVALLKGLFVGTGALWDGAVLRHIWVTQAEPYYVGLTSIAATQGLIGPRDAVGRRVTLGAEPAGGLLSVLGPGLVRRFAVAVSRELREREPDEIHVGEPSVLALDGEREHNVAAGTRLQVTLYRDGPWLIEPDAALRAWAGCGQSSSRDRGA